MKFLRLLFVTAVLAAPTPAVAQRDPNQMCGDGTVTKVILPGRPTGVDERFGLFRTIDVPALLPPDSIEIPNGCSIYAFLVGGFSQNPEFNEMVFYPLAEYVAKQNGYVHMSWWNNLLAPYMERPLHEKTIRIERLFGLIAPLDIPTGPENPFAVNKLEALFGPTIADLPKANPDEDYQFQSDAALVIKAIKAANPTALIVVAGHSMGGASVVRLGADKTVPIDVLAPIDAGNNRDKPQGLAGTPTANRSRWRSAFDWKGYREWDCEREGLFCKDSDPRLLFFSFKCGPVGPFLDKRPLLNSNAPLICPRLTPYMDPGKKVVLGENVNFLYHRWQREAFPPSDFLQAYELVHWRPRSQTPRGGNYQKEVETCRLGVDPTDSQFPCFTTDGHGEIIGHRGAIGNVKAGLELTGDWPKRAWDPVGAFDPEAAEARRKYLIKLAIEEGPWPYRPENPRLCLVCDDLVDIVKFLHERTTPPAPDDTIPPEAVATASPEPNAAGWNKEDVVVQISAVDPTPGSGVKEIETLLAGAQTATLVIPGAEAEQTISAAGMTILSYFARDNEGNRGTDATLTIKIDMTLPEISGDTDGPPNVHGWFNRNVTVSFTATDEPGGSGLAFVTPSVVVAFETDQEIVSGTATDVADNDATAQVKVSIDKTSPLIVLSSRTVANAFGWNKTDVALSWNCSDALSGPVSPSVGETVSSEGIGQQATAHCTDKADNTAPDTVGDINIDKTAPTITLVSRTAANASGWINSAFAASWDCADGLSGPVSPRVGQTVSGEGMNQQATATCTDRADNSASHSVAGLNIDLTAPAIALLSRTPANAATWNNTAVALSWSCADALSGVVAATVGQTLATQGAAQQATGTCADKADNTATHTVSPINIDVTAPAIALVSRTSANVAGWNNTDVLLSWSCDDALSGVVSATVGQTVSGEGAALQGTGVCGDVAGNSASNTVAGIKIDKTAPSISIVSPPDGAIFLLNAPATANFGCADALSGPATCVGSTPNGGGLDTSTVGGKSLMVTATDVAGNAATAASSYAVRYVFSGFASPIAAPTLMTTARAGRTIPIKYVLSDGNGTVIVDLASFASLTSKPIACDGSSEGGVAEETEAPGSTLITFADGTFQYNWKTESSWTGCRLLELRLNDGAVHTAKFQFR